MSKEKIYITGKDICNLIKEYNLEDKILDVEDPPGELWFIVREPNNVSKEYEEWVLNLSNKHFRKVIGKIE